MAYYVEVKEGTNWSRIHYSEYDNKAMEKKAVKLSKEFPDVRVRLRHSASYSRDNIAITCYWAGKVDTTPEARQDRQTPTTFEKLVLPTDFEAPTWRVNCTLSNPAHIAAKKAERGYNAKNIFRVTAPDGAYTYYQGDTRKKPVDLTQEQVEAVIQRHNAANAARQQWIVPTDFDSRMGWRALQNKHLDCLTTERVWSFLDDVAEDLQRLNRPEFAVILAAIDAHQEGKG